MPISDRTYAEDIDHRERHLSLLVSVALVAMAAGMVLLMYPVVFSHEEFPGKRTLHIAFFGFCALSVLLVGYLLERQRTIRKLRGQLFSELRRFVDLQRQTSAEVLQTLPDLSHFRDSLAMQFRRSASSQGTLSVIVVSLKDWNTRQDVEDTQAAFGDAAKSLSHKLRGEDSIFQLGSGYFGLLLPNTDTRTANHYAEGLREALQETARPNSRFAFDLLAVNYPEHAGSVHELEEVVCNQLSERSLELRTSTLA